MEETLVLRKPAANTLEELARKAAGKRLVHRVAVALAAFLLLPAFKNAAMKVPEALAAIEPVPVSGHQVRTLNKPMAFGEFRAEGVREGVEFSWSVELFGIRGGLARMRYRFTLAGPGETAHEVECRSRAIEAWRDGWSVELTGAFTPKLACGIRTKAELLRLVLGVGTGRGLRGALVGDNGAERLEVRSIHALEGSRLPLDVPAGYALTRSGVDVAAVETLDRGRVWLAADLDAEARALSAAAAAALLLYEPEITAQLD